MQQAVQRINSSTVHLDTTYRLLYDVLSRSPQQIEIVELVRLNFITATPANVERKQFSRDYDAFETGADQSLYLVVSDAARGTPASSVNRSTDIHSR